MTLSSSLAGRNEDSSGEEESADALTYSDHSIVEVSSDAPVNQDSTIEVPPDSNETMDLGVDESASDGRTSPGMSPGDLSPSEDPQLPSVLHPSFIRPSSMDQQWP